MASQRAEPATGPRGRFLPVRRFTRRLLRGSRKGQGVYLSLVVDDVGQNFNTTDRSLFPKNETMGQTRLDSDETNERTSRCLAQRGANAAGNAFALSAAQHDARQVTAHR